MKKESTKAKRDARVRRAKRVRRQIRGTQVCPRLSVFRSNRHIFAQIIDDDAGVTLAAATSLKLNGATAEEGATAKIAAAKAVGSEVARLASEKGINKVVFDRSGYKFHGRVAALAEGARSGGLKF